MEVEVHLISIREFFHELPQLFQRIKKLHPSSTIEVIGFYKPNITTLIHLFIKVKLSIYHAFVFAFCLNSLVLCYMLIYLRNLLINWNGALFLHTFNAVKELAEFIDFLQAVLR